jgi:hypothetical protein
MRFTNPRRGDDASVRTNPFVHEESPESMLAHSAAASRTRNDGQRDERAHPDINHPADGKHPGPGPTESQPLVTLLDVGHALRTAPLFVGIARNLGEICRRAARKEVRLHAERIRLIGHALQRALGKLANAAFDHITTLRLRNPLGQQRLEPI